MIRIPSPIAARTFSSSSIVRAEEYARSAEQKQRAQDRDLAKKNEQRKMTRRRALAREPADKSPYYQDIHTALRYLRAAEVGRSPSEAVITVTSVIVSERGNAKIAGSVNFPKPLKETKTLFFTNDPAQAEAARNAGVTLVGGDDLIAQIKEGTLDLSFDRAFATPDIASALSPVARQLGPKGLMPNAKRGTVVEDIQSALSEVGGSTPFRQKSNDLSIAVGRVNFTDKEIMQNIIAVSRAFREAIQTQKVKKKAILGQTTITSTHGPGMVIDFK